jgi:hypothetical protein
VTKQLKSGPAAGTSSATANRNSRQATKASSAKAAAASAATPEAADIETMLRPLARRHCEAAIAALAAVVADPAAPANARITAATTLIGWAFGREAAGGEGAAKRGMAEQVVRLTWGESETF